MSGRQPNRRESHLCLQRVKPVGRHHLAMQAIIIAAPRRRSSNSKAERTLGRSQRLQHLSSCRHNFLPDPIPRHQRNPIDFHDASLSLTEQGNSTCSTQAAVHETWCRRRAEEESAAGCGCSLSAAAKRLSSRWEWRLPRLPDWHRPPAGFAGSSGIASPRRKAHSRPWTVNGAPRVKIKIPSAAAPPSIAPVTTAGFGPGIDKVGRVGEV